jgi:N4-gp56 family major capsid protein
MAATTFARGGTNTNLVPQLWKREDFKFAYERNPLLPYIGDGDGKVIQTDMDFTKKQGDRMTFGLRALLSGDGQGKDGAYSGNSEAMTFHDMSVDIAERGHSTALNGNYTEQAAYTKLRPKGQVAMREWVGMVQASDIICALSGLVCKNHIAGRVTGEDAEDVSNVLIKTVSGGTADAPTKGTTAVRWFGGGQNALGTVFERVAADADIDNTTNNLFGTDVIEYVHRMATKTVDASGNAVSPIRPIYVGGEPYYLMLIDRLQKKQLQADTKWKNATLNALPRDVRKNWIFTGADGVWDNVVIKTTDLLHRRVGAGGFTADEFFDITGDACASGVTVARALFLGAQAAVLGWGKMPVWKTGYSDPPHNTKYVVHTDMLYGVRKSIFNSTEFGCICVDTAVLAD